MFCLHEEIAKKLSTNAYFSIPILLMTKGILKTETALSGVSISKKKT